jgi:uncharacterized protein
MYTTKSIVKKVVQSFTIELSGERDRMNVLEFTLLVLLTSLLAGFLGSLVGLGGGTILVPTLTLLFHVDIRYAIGASLVSVIATSSGAASAYVKEGFTNTRTGMLLEVATTLGAVGGAALAARLSPSILAVISGVLLLFSAYLSSHPVSKCQLDARPCLLATRLRLDDCYPTANGWQPYRVQNVLAGFGLMGLVGICSSLLGMSGSLKVITMDQVMKLPFKVSTTTSNFMSGVTAAAGVGTYLSRGYIDPGLSMPVMLGVLAGSFLGVRVLVLVRSQQLRQVFSGVVVLLAVQMLYKGMLGRI